jgi:hypothetical protein
MQELMATLSAIHKKEHRQQKFMAALQGVDIDKDDKGEQDKAVTFEEVKSRAIAKATGNQEAANAALFGFDKIDGTGYSLIGA